MRGILGEKLVGDYNFVVFSFNVIDFERRVGYILGEFGEVVSFRIVEWLLYVLV